MYRLLNPMVMLNASQQVECLMSDEILNQDGTITEIVKAADVVVFARIQVVHRSNLEKVLTQIKELGICIAFEHDDWYYDLSPSTYKKSLIDKDSLDNTKWMATQADLITSTNEFLNENTVKITKAKPLLTRAIPNALIMDEWDQLRKAKRRNSGVVRVMITGATNHYIDWIEVMPALERLKKKYGTRVQFIILGYAYEVTLKDIGSDSNTKLFNEHNILLNKGFSKIGAYTYPSVDFSKYPEKLCSLSPDIGIIITSNRIYDKCKSTLKFAEYTAAGAAVVCKKELPYTAEISDDLVRYADSIEDYVNEISYLIDHPVERYEMWKRAKDFADTRYSMNKVWEEWYDAFKTVVELKKKDSR